MRPICLLLSLPFDYFSCVQNNWNQYSGVFLIHFLYFVCRDLDAENRMMMDYYIKPWARYQSYGVGVLFGYALWFCQSRHNGRLPVNRV